MTQRFIGILVLGVLVGVGVIYGLTTGFNNIPQVNTPQQKQTTPQPSPQTDNRDQQSQQEKEAQQQLDELRTRLFEEGFTSNATVDVVYPGIGFIIRDTKGERLFVEWQETPPQSGQQVRITGTVTQVEKRLDTLQNKPGFSDDLRRFLENQRIMIIATEVTPV